MSDPDVAPAGPLRRALRSLLGWIEGAFDRPFGQAGNPWRHLGGLAFFLFWIVAVSGIYVYIGFDTEVDGAYASVERLSSNEFPLGSLARGLHRYASDAFVLVVLLHLAREWILGRYAHFRRFSWLTGVFALWLVYASGIGGFWLVWDRIAQYSLIATTEWLDALPVFDGSLARNFIAEGAVNDRLFSLFIFLHIGIPLALLAVMWVHLQRLARPETSPPRALAWATLGALVLLSIAVPVASDAPADLAAAPGSLALDWFYLGVHAFADATSPLTLWLAAGGLTVLLALLPWVSRAARAPRPVAAAVDLANCNGCARCFADCPYAAVTMQPRTDGRNHRRQAVVDPDLCAGCGICAGACPSSTPFRSVAELVSGIDMPQAPIQALRSEVERALARFSTPPSHGATTAATASDRTGERAGEEVGERTGRERAAARGPAIPRIVAFSCRSEHGGPDLSAVADEHTATVSMLCAAQLPPSFVEFALRAGADGVLVTGCREGDCLFRLGNRWTEERLNALREPHLRAAVPRDRLRIAWAGRGDEAQLHAVLAAFRAELATATAAHRAAFAPPPKRSESHRERAHSE